MWKQKKYKRTRRPLVSPSFSLLRSKAKMATRYIYMFILYPLSIYYITCLSIIIL